MKSRGTQDLNSNSYTQGYKEEMHWIPIKDLGKYKAFPSFMKDYLNKENLSSNIETITARINGINGNKLQAMKNRIQACWDKSSKSFKKSTSVSKDAFDAIEEATKGTKNKQIGRYALIGGLLTALATFSTYQIVKLVKSKKQSQEIAKANVPAQNVNIP